MFEYLCHVASNCHGERDVFLFALGNDWTLAWRLLFAHARSR